MHASANPAIPPAIKWVDGATLGLLFTFFFSADMFRETEQRSEKSGAGTCCYLCVLVVLLLLCVQRGADRSARVRDSRVCHY